MELERLRDALAPGARAIRSRPLIGGLDSGTYALTFEGPGEKVAAAVLRRYDLLGRDEAYRRLAREEATLRALATTRLPVPRVLLLDAGALLGEPFLAMSRVDGELRPPPTDRTRWILELAATLARVHASGSDGDLTDLPRSRGPVEDAKQVSDRERPDPADPLWPRIVDALVERGPATATAPATLTHRDYWFGNVLWTGRRVSGLVDWGDAAIGDPGFDVAYARLDMQLALGSGAANAFLRAYEASRGVVRGLAYWDLRVCVPALRWLDDWVGGYNEVGLTQLTVGRARSEVEAFAQSALERRDPDASI